MDLGRIEKGWGFEILWCNNESFSGKLLVFSHAGAKTSMVYHSKRRKCWFINEGTFKLRFCDTKTGEFKEVELPTGSAFEVSPLSPHQLTCTSDSGIIFEVGTTEDGEDRYRISPGDSQTQPVAPPPVPGS